MTQHSALTELRAALLHLSPAQQAAVEALAAGATHEDAAAAAGVARETVTRWVGHHCAVRAALNLHRAVAAEEQLDRTLRIRAKALTAVEDALDAGTLEPLAVLRTIPPPPPQAQGPVLPAVVFELATRATRISLLPLGPPRDENGRIDRITELLDDSGPTDDERAELLTVERLAAASGLLGINRELVGDQKCPEVVPVHSEATDAHTSHHSPSV